MSTPVRLVVVGSTNPVKLAAVRAVVQRAWPDCEVRSIAADSGVAAQPIGDEETRQGARTRARNALAADPEADLGVGLEGGVVVEPDGAMRTCAWASIVDRHGAVGDGGSLAMPLPTIVADRVRAGDELGVAMDAVARAVGTKYGRGAVGILTAGLIDRQGAYEPLVTYALVRWLAPAYFDAGR